MSTKTTRASSPAVVANKKSDADAKTEDCSVLQKSERLTKEADDPQGFVAGLRSLFEATKGSAWPVLNIYLMMTASHPAKEVNEKGDFSGGTLRGYAGRLSDHLAVQAGSVPKIGLAIIVWNFTVDFEAASLGWSGSFCGWESKVLYRDLFLMLVIAGGWDWLLYFSPFKNRLMPYKFNKKYPPLIQLRRDVFWTTSATVLASLQEILLMKWWAGSNFHSTLFGTAPVGETEIPWNVPFFGSDYTPYFVMWTLTMFYWRIAHFYFIHRNMHPWWNRKFAHRDVGAFLYRHVHSHHHKSHNPTAFSGISMTPIESIAYISAALIPLCFRHGCHPWIHLYTKIDLIVGAQIGHSGFDEFGGGNYFHQMHHAHFECNYGHSLVPLDWLMGTFEDGSSYDTTKKDTKMEAHQE